MTTASSGPQQLRTTLRLMLLRQSKTRCERHGLSRRKEDYDSSPVRQISITAPASHRQRVKDVLQARLLGSRCGLADSSSSMLACPTATAFWERILMTSNPALSSHFFRGSASCTYSLFRANQHECGRSAMAVEHDIQHSRPSLCRVADWGRACG